MGNREIKFRGWDGYRMRSWDDISKRLGFQHWILEGCEGVTLMQYTGLKDKNGAEIYEGDLLKGFYRYADGYGGEWRTLTVKYHAAEGAFGFAVTTDGGTKQPFENYCNFLFQIDDVEIIGNVHQQPELLEAKQTA